MSHYLSSTDNLEAAAMLTIGLCLAWVFTGALAFGALLLAFLAARDLMYERDR